MPGERAAEKLKERIPEAILGVEDMLGQAVVLVKPESIVEVCRFLRDDEELAFNLLSDLTAVDVFESEPRFQVVYHLTSLKTHDRLRLKVPVYAGEPALPSVTDVWPGANWFEREVYDMFGITFTGHPDLTRILMPDDEQGHPLRKDFPLLGTREETVLLYEDVRDVL